MSTEEGGSGWLSFFIWVSYCFRFLFGVFCCWFCLFGGGGGGGGGFLGGCGYGFFFLLLLFCYCCWR